MLYNLGVFLYNQGKNNEAARSFQKVVNLKPDHLKAQLNLGACFVKLGLFTKARDQYNIVLKLDPDNSKAKHNLSVIQKKF